MEKYNMKIYLWNILISIDQLIAVVFSPVLNVVFKGPNKFGEPDETLSSVFGKNVKLGKCKGCYFICRLLHLFDKNHCKKSIEVDEGSTS